MASQDSSLTPGQLEILARQHFDDVVAFHEYRYRKLGVLEPEEREKETRSAETYVGGSLELLRINDWPVAREIASDLLNDAGLGKPDRGSFLALCRLLLRAEHAAAKLRRARLDGDYTTVSGDLLFDAAPEAGTSRPDSRNKGPHLADLIDLHVSSKKAEWEKQTLKQNQTTFRMFKEHVGNPKAGAVTRKQVSEFIEALKRLPGKYGQLPAYRGKTLSEMLTLADREPDSVSRLTRKTLNRHASAISGVFTWATLNGHWDGPSPASGFVDKRNLFGSRERRPWRPNELKTLFNSDVWRGRKAVRNHRFFIPLMGLFCGFTLEEACKLKAEEVRLDDGIWLFDIQPSDEGRLKDSARQRTVPVHPKLIEFGFIRHVEAVKAKGGGPLWGDLNKSEFDDKRSTLFSKWFSRHCTGLGIKPSRKPGEPLLDFHSFRKNVGDAVRATGYSETVANDILGHEAKTMSYRTYSTGPHVKKLHQAICDIKYDVDLSHLALR